MPVRLRFTLEGAAPSSPFEHANGLRALVLRWLEAADSALSAAVHDPNQLKPITISPVWPAGEAHVFEVTALVDWLVRPLLQGEACLPPEVVLGPQAFRLSGMDVVERTSWEELLALPPRFEELELRLLSPTAHVSDRPFRQRHVLPDPGRYYGGWLQRWNLCCERPLSPALLPVVREQFREVAREGRTEQAFLHNETGEERPGGCSASRRKHKPFTGFQGAVTFRLLEPHRLPPPTRAELAALGRFAHFCGTGKEMLRGMGQTRTLVR